MKLEQLVKLYPQYTTDELNQLRTTYNNVKGRCNTTSPNYKQYWDVDFKFKDLNEFIEFIINEKEHGRDYFTIDHPHISRLFDKGEYSFNNCVIKSATANVKEATANSYKIYNHADGKTTLFTNLYKFYKKNKAVLGMSYSTLVRRVKNSELINVSNGDYSHFVKITEL